jgi:hypothetical protein
VLAAANDLAGGTEEVAVLEPIRDRFAATMSEARRAELDADLRSLRSPVSAGNARAAADIADVVAARRRSSRFNTKAFGGPGRAMSRSVSSPL